MVSYNDIVSETPKQSSVIDLSWWTKHKSKVYGVILFMVGLLGGNVDRFNDIVGTVSEAFCGLKEETGDTSEASSIKSELDQFKADILDALKRLEPTTPYEESPNPNPNPNPDSDRIPIE